ncbi:protein kinase domain-containing protein [Pseudonocardia sichuanensis]|uniref:non-specific serine/threonine protein kinase n=1 Tax=Pseudonocardia kunmingensis TaxID=630975 RepID=A0A543D9I2_9PSEU|nr:serine/threonine-protein kinase [Pseudonocardia kunmingensis]TQM05999.1 serine/threonine protein kinase [Pseudonocardia kunmingensis]
MEIGGVSEVAQALRVSRQRLAKLRERSDFPAALGDLAQGPVWDLAVIRAWNGSGLRTSAAGRPRSAAADQTLGGRFLLEESIGSGGFADVFRAYDRKNSGSSPEIVAVKMLRNVHLADPDIVERFRRELGLLEKCSHPNVMTVLASGETSGGGHWFAMPLAQQSLADEIEEFAGQPALILDVMKQVCAGLTYLHDQSILHRDLKPDNILRTAQGSWAIADFGLAVEVERATRLTPHTRFGMGTDDYSAPEQLRNAYDATVQSDVYALGKVLQHLVTGDFPNSAAVPNSIFRSVIETAISPRPADRHPSAAAFCAAVERAVASLDNNRPELPNDTAARLLARVRLPKPEATALDELISWAASLDEDDEEDMAALTRVLPWIRPYAIRMLWQSRPSAFSNVFSRFTGYIAKAEFSFEFCDVLADFCRHAVDATRDLRILRETTTALCELGARYNRWHVRSTVATMLQGVRTTEQACAAVEGLTAASEGAVRWTVTEFTLRSLHPHLRHHVQNYFDESTTPG